MLPIVTNSWVGMVQSLFWCRMTDAGRCSLGFHFRFLLARPPAVTTETCRSRRAADREQTPRLRGRGRVRRLHLRRLRHRQRPPGPRAAAAGGGAPGAPAQQTPAPAAAPELRPAAGPQQRRRPEQLPAREQLAAAGARRVPVGGEVGGARGSVRPLLRVLRGPGLPHQLPQRPGVRRRGEVRADR